MFTILTAARLKPVDAVTRRLELAGIIEGALFRPIDRHSSVLPEPLSTRSIAEIVKKPLRSQVLIDAILGKAATTGALSQEAGSERTAPAAG